VRSRITRFVLLVGAAVALASGFALAADRIASPSDQGVSGAAKSRVVLTLRDHGRTIVVARSQRLLLVLGGRYRWSEPTSGGAIRASEVVSDAPTGAQTWELRALRAGVATLRSLGKPACRPTAAGCPETARRYVVELDVRR
jgi:hypothetical protein